MKLALLAAMFVASAPLDLATAQVTASRPQPTRTVDSKPAPAPGGPAAPQLVSFGVGGNDSCASAAATDAISGSGTFAVDTTAASSGTPLGACGAIGRDVWFYYTSSITGQTTVSTCAQTSADTVIAVWADGSPAGSCPTTPILCLDDFCGLQTQVTFCVTAGTSYFLEFGSYANGPGYNATFSLSEVPTPPPTNEDDCALPINLIGDGPHPFDTTGATTGCQGQTESACLFFGFTSVFNDEWYSWTASTTDLYEVTLCSGTTHPDTRLAVYAGAGCPTGSALACNDDACGFVSALCFSAVAGQTYTIQIGAFASGQTGAGNILFVPRAGGPGPCSPLDDGTSENSVGLGGGGALAWMVGFGQGQPSTSISAIDTCFGTPLFPGGYVPSGPVTVAIWDDPNDDGDITDGVLMTTFSAVISPGSVDTDVFQVITLPSPVVVTGIFFVGAVVTHSAGEFPGPLDQSFFNACESNPGSWVAGNTSGTFDFSTLTANDVPPVTMASVGLPGNWLLGFSCCTNPDAGVPFCFGDGTGTACPCANNCSNVAGTGSGCCNSQGVGGVLKARTGPPCPMITGGASISNDTVVLLGTFMPNSSALYFQGTTRLNAGNGFVFGDGLRCAGGTIVRLGTKTNVAGGSQYPGPGDLSISVKGMITLPGTRTYQIWYRNAAAFCTASTFNLSNGYEIVWGV